MVSFPHRPWTVGLVWNIICYNVQAITAYRNFCDITEDHTIIFFSFVYRDWHVSEDPAKRDWNYTAIRTDLQNGALETKIQDTLPSDTSQLMIQSLREGRIDHFWRNFTTAGEPILESYLQPSPSFGNWQSLALRQLKQHRKQFRSFCLRPFGSNSRILRLFRAFHQVAHLQAIDRNIRRQREADLARRKLALETDFFKALRERKWKRAWSLFRTLGGQRVGPKKRRIGSARMCNPSALEWSSYLSQPGSRGGMKTFELIPPTPLAIDVLQFAETMSSVGIPLTSEPPTQDRICAAQEVALLKKNFHAEEKGKQVPRWSLPAQAWDILLLSSPYIVEIVTEFCLAIRRYRSAPVAWLSLSVPKLTM